MAGFGLEYMPGGAKYGQPSPFTSTLGNAPQPQSTVGQPTGNSYGFNPIPAQATVQQPQSAVGQPTGNSYGFNPISTPGTKAQALPNSNMPQADNGLGYISPQDSVIDAMASRQRPTVSMYNPLKGLLKIGSY